MPRHSRFSKSHKYWLTLFLCFTPKAIATSVAVIVFANFIVIAVDSKRVEFRNGKRIVTTDCKLHHVSDTYFVVSGKTELMGQYDAVTVARKAVKAAGDPKVAATDFAERMRPKMLWVVQQMNNWPDAPDTKVFAQSPTMLGAVFIRFKNGIPFINIRRFEWQRTQKHTFALGKTVVYDCVGVCNSSLANVYRMGMFVDSPDIKQTIRDRNTAASGAVALIRADIPKYGEYVGEPISEVTLDIMGAYWLNDEACKAESAPKTKRQAQKSNNATLHKNQ